MKNQIIEEVRNFVAQYQQNNTPITGWEAPLVGFAAADDPLFVELKRVVIDSHALPKDLLPEAKTVIAFFLPFTKATAHSNIKEELSSPQWAACYIETNELIRQLSDHLKEYMSKRGEKAVTVPATHNWIEDKLISNWSHRHIGYIAGLGRFGLNNMLITEQGCSGRIGSLVISARIEPDLRSDIEACLYKYDGSCKQCIRRCVNDALGEDGFDRFKCFAQLLLNVEEYKNLGYADVCGKCLAATPCTHTDPVKLKLQAAKGDGDRNGQ